MHPLASVAQIVLTGKTASGKKEIDFTISAQVRQNVDALWTKAKLWHKVYGRTLADSAAAQSEETREAAAKKRREEKERAKAAEAAAAAKAERAALKARLIELGEVVSSSDEDETIGDALNAKAGGGSARKGAAGSGGVAALGGSDDEEARGKQKSAVDDEEEWLREYEADRQKEKEKEKFWRRDQFINDDSEGEEGEEGDGEGSVAGSEALEEGQRAKEKAVEVGKMSSQQVFDLMHSDTQRVLRRASSNLPCIKDKKISINSVIHKIERRRVTEATAAPVVVEEEEEELEWIACAQCNKRLDAADVPLRDVTLSKADCPAALFCSNLCISQHRRALCRGVGAEEVEVPALSRGLSRSLSNSTFSREMSEASLAAGAAAAADAPPDDGKTSGAEQRAACMREGTEAEAQEEEEEEDDMLVVLPLAVKESERESRCQLTKLQRVKSGSGISMGRWGSLRRQLRDDASMKRKEDARNTGRYVETEPSQLLLGDEADGLEEGMAVDGADAEDEGGDSSGAEEEAGAEEGAQEETEGGDASAESAWAAEGGKAPLVEGGDGTAASAAGSAMSAGGQGLELELDPLDDLAQLVAARRRKEAETAAMKENVHAQMTAAMDTGVRVNHALAQMYGVAAPSRDANGVLAADGTARPAEATSAAEGETQEDERRASCVEDEDGGEDGGEAAAKTAQQVLSAKLSASIDGGDDEAEATTNPPAHTSVLFGRTFEGKFRKNGPKQAKLGFAAATEPAGGEGGGLGGFQMPAPIDESLEEHERHLDRVEEEQMRAAAAKEAARQGEEEAAHQDAGTRKRKASSLVLDEAEESADEGDGETGGGGAAVADDDIEESAAGEEEDLGIVDDDEIEDEDEGSHARHAAELAAADDDADLAALARGLKKRQRAEGKDKPADETTNAGAKVAKRGGNEAEEEGAGARRRGKAARRKAAEEVEAEEAAEEEGSDGISVASDSEALSSIEDFIAEDDEVDAEVEAAERLAEAEDGEAVEEEEEHPVERVIRSRLGAAWIVADRSAPAFEAGDGLVNEDDEKTAAKLRLELRAKRQREKQLAEAQQAERVALAGEEASGRRSALTRGTDTDGGSRLFAHEERSLSSFNAFSVLSDTTLGAAPAPKRQASASSSVVKPGGRGPPSLMRSSSLPTAAAPTATAPTAAAPAAGSAATTFGMMRVGGLAAGAATASKPAVGGAAGGVAAGSAGAPSRPPPVSRLASFQQDRERLSATMRAQLGPSHSATTTSSRTFVFRSEASLAATTTDEPSRGAGSERSASGIGEKSSGSLGPVAGHSNGGGSSGGGASSRRTPPLPLASKAGASKFGALGKPSGVPSAGSGGRGASLLATVLKGKSWARTK